jgi:hypothetical protein
MIHNISAKLKRRIQVIWRTIRKMLEKKRNRLVKYIDEYDKRLSFEDDLFYLVYLFNEDDFVGKKY